MEKYILSGFMDEYADDFNTQLRGAKALGLSHMELRSADGINVAAMELSQVREYARRLRDNGIGVSAIGSPLGKIPLDGDLHAHMETAKKIFEFAGILGTKHIRVFSFYIPDGLTADGCQEQVWNAMGMLLDTAKAFDVVLCHENEALIYGDTPQRCLALMKRFPQLRCVFDMGNFVLEQVEPYAAYRLLKPYIAYFHIKDALYAGAVVPPGTGDAQIRRILLEYGATRDSGVMVTLEPHLQSFTGLNAIAGKAFTNLYQYPDQQTAFTDAAHRFQELMR